MTQKLLTITVKNRHQLWHVSMTGEDRVIATVTKMVAASANKVAIYYLANFTALRGDKPKALRNSNMVHPRSLSEAMELIEKAVN